MATAETLRVRDIMTEGTQCIGENESMLDAARMMRDLNVGSLPICGTDDRLKGIITDRDIVVQCCAEGMDLSKTKASQLSGPLHWIDADAPITECLEMMETHQIKRLPVIDVRDSHRLVGMVSEQNLARNISDDQLAEFVERVYA
ncbi:MULTISPECIES: CBS domain-containing protein [unclassified Streptomyces]|uniref:CBS domain-containing protein n=1 Tax=unclassified Streptomyces TaxID=2593676 RepID=UPI003FD4ADCA